MGIREELKEHKLTEQLFDRFGECLRDLNVELKSGQIVDAKQKTHNLAQRDTDARWTKKNGENIYGYKDHVNVDRDTKLITAWEDTPAQVHDSQALEAMLRSLEEGSAEIHADRAYRNAEQETRLIETEYVSQINEKRPRVHPLSDEHKTVNRTKSKICSRVEHVFGAMTNEMGGICIRTIGRA